MSEQHINENIAALINALENDDEKAGVKAAVNLLHNFLLDIEHIALDLERIANKDQ